MNKRHGSFSLVEQTMLATYLILFILISLVLGEILVYFGICLQTQFQEPILLALSRGNNSLIVWIRILMFAIFVYWVYTSISILCSWRIFHGPIDWSDGVALNLLILQSSLMGFSLFAWMVLDKLHPVIMENISIRKIIKAERKILQERKLHMEGHCRVLQGKVADLTAKMKKLKMDYQMKANKARAEGAIVLELQNNFEEFRLKYDRLFDYNQTLRNQLQSISHEVQKIDESNEWSNLKTKLGFPTVENNGKYVDFENVSETATKYGEYPFSATPSSSSPRHRRPIYQC